MLKNSDLNESAFTELIPLFDVSSSSGKIVSGFLKSRKTKVYEDGNSSMAWEKLKKKFDPVFVPTLVKTGRLFRETS